MLVYMTWLSDQWCEPSKTDYYLMMIACEVRRVLSRRPNQIKLSHFRLQFGSGDNRRKPASREQAAAWSKAAWLGRMTMPVVRAEGPPAGAGFGMPDDDGDDHSDGALAEGD